ncbi:MAG: zinc-binding dehydrogenase [Thermaurantiacus sp.]
MKAILLDRYPDGVPRAADFALADVPQPEPGEGQLLVRVSHLSMDPFPRLRMRADSRVGPPMALGGVVEGRGVGEVVASRHPDFQAGDWLTGETGWAELAVLDGQRAERIDLSLGPPQAHLHALGATGLAATFVVESIFPRLRETVVVAPAAGAVGSLVCQIARHVAPEARVMGTARGTAQAEFLRGMGVEPLDPDADWPGPGGIDALVDGVGGTFHDRMLRALNPRARVLLLGFVAGYNDTGPPRYGNAHSVLMKRAQMWGFLLSDHMDRADEARARIATWLRDGHVRPAMSVHAGLGSAPAAFAALFGEPPPGKQIVRVADDGED